MTTEYTLIEAIANTAEVPDSGIHSNVVFSNESLRVTTFGFAAGEELSDHSTPMDAVLHFLDGEGEVTCGGERHTVTGGAWMHMEPNLLHGVKATTPMKMLLIVCRAARDG